MCSISDSMSDKKQNIFFVGFMGAGKSTLASRVAKKLGFRFIDTDKYIEQKHKVTVTAYIETNGIEAFRKAEHETLLEIVQQNYCVVATGGGLPCYHGNIDIINANGFSIYLKFSPEFLFQRLKNSKNIRPLVKGKTEIQLLGFIKTTLKERESDYLKAHHVMQEVNIKTEMVLKPVYAFLGRE